MCAVIPAAGRGTRLGHDLPKIMIGVADGVTVWDVLRERLTPSAAHVHVVVSPSGEGPFTRLVSGRAGVSVSVQREPTGMGDAIFGATPYWAGYDTILVVWGDQANLSAETVRRVVAAHPGKGLTVPLVAMDDPYVEYELAGGELVRVRQSREGEECRPGGLSDIGVFCLATGGLREAWERYAAGAPRGAATGEVNFLPFLPYLSQVEGLPVTVVPVTDPDEARGINTADDLEFARRAYARCRG
ncbi:MAG: NTP transferase domain-containing protein [Nonomuraea sp.]|nr:NTP transferase domain-containing protein [Nonomuraea sp.]